MCSHHDAVGAAIQVSSRCRRYVHGITNIRAGRGGAENDAGTPLYGKRAAATRVVYKESIPRQITHSRYASGRRRPAPPRNAPSEAEVYAVMVRRRQCGAVCIAVYASTPAPVTPASPKRDSRLQA
ncbi:hypothetical protein NPIL_405081 [Nephila pilipes]|uniref:Uncharacterized protein n=1 Tax=Nephila pilipes TaxID=299642 RepID=A0A8X6TU21_NEPPI|nr:hypothetical protein NPIL_405081 [Nephila pilipes]